MASHIHMSVYECVMQVDMHAQVVCVTSTCVIPWCYLSLTRTIVMYMVVHKSTHAHTYIHFPYTPVQPW